MPIVNRIADYATDMAAWRQHLHTIPELGVECHKTSAFVQERLAEFGVDEVHTGFATTGIVAIINGQGDGPTIGLRADMDGLPIPEATGLDYASTHEGKMHACGHDGHTTMLLGAAKYLAETRNFSGRVALIFQPAEETGGGAEVMVQEGIMDTFDINEVYALHNAPGFDHGSFYTTPGPIMAAVDTFHVHINGVGGHGAMPHETRDPVVAACGITQAIQTIVSRNHYALNDLVVSVTQIHTGTVDNVIPSTAYINGTVRTFDPAVQSMVMERMEAIVAGQAASYGVEATLDYVKGYPATVNDPAKSELAAKVAMEIAGEDNVVPDAGREMGAEDFSYMLEKRPGAYLFLGQGESAGLHHPEYNFNDEVAPVGASFFARMVEVTQPVGGNDMGLEDASKEMDMAFTREDLKGPSFELTFAGATSFLRRKYTKDLTGVDIAVTGIPFDQAVTNRPGTRLGPRAIREASALQAPDAPYGWPFDVLSEFAIIDYGDVAFDYANIPAFPATVTDHIRGILKEDVASVVLGGDHYISFPILKAYAEKYGPMSLIQVDAHTDTWVDDDMDRVDHGTMFYKAVKMGLVDPARSVQIGIRTTNEDTMGVHIIDAAEVHDIGAAAVAAKARAIVGDHPVYLSFDIDGLDPAFAPGTGTPVWGGLSSAQAARLLRDLAGINIKGGDIVEVSPPFDTTGATAIAGAHVATEILSLIGWNLRT